MGVEYLACRQVGVMTLLSAGLSWSVVGSPALSHPDPVAGPASLPCAILLACSGTKPAEPHSSSYSPCTDLVMAPPLQDAYTNTPEHAVLTQTYLHASFS